MRKKGKGAGVSPKVDKDTPRLKVASEGGSFEEPMVGQTLDGTIVSWNTAAERLIGFSGEEVIGRNILTVIPPDMVGESNLFLDRIRSGETVQDFETVRLRKDGTRVNVSLQAAPVRDEKGEVIGATVVVRDISDRKKLEETLTRSDVNYRLLAEKSRIGIVVVQDGIIRFVNPWGADTIGHGTTELLSSSFVEVVHPDDRPMALAHLSRVEARQPEATTRTIRIIDRSGEVSWMSIHSTPFSWEGHPASLNFLVDVTNRVLVRDEMRKSWEESADALLVVDREGVVQFVNNGAARLFERRPEEMTGKPFEFPLVLDHPTEIEIATDLGTREFAEMRVIWAEWDEKPAYLVSLKNITEQKRMEEDLKNSEEIYRRFISTMNDGAWFIDSKGITRFVNTKMSEMLGYTPDEMQEKPFFSYIDRRFQKISRVWLQRRRQGIKEKNEFELIRKDGSIIYSIVSTAPIANKFGKYMGSIAVVVDI
ncbi:MAG: PAS domain S-box protein, partial [Methanoregulaceae archaeon]|nr:PAS domain S-box protein [Methanoregulaceae archaeon]